MIRQWLDLFQKFVQPPPVPTGGRGDPLHENLYGFDELSPWRRLFGRNPEILDVEAEVADEQQGRVVLLSRVDDLGRLLLMRLRGRAPAPTSGRLVREGFFTLATLPALTATSATDASFTNTTVDPWADPDNLIDRLTQLGPSSDLFLYLLREDEGWQPEDAQWCARLRVCAAPLLPVVLTADPIQAEHYAPSQERLAAAVQRDLAVRPVFIAQPRLDETIESGSTEPDPTELVNELIQRILAVRPRLAMALAQEVTCCRPAIARRVIRTAALMSALVGSEPIPLLDLPLQVSVQWKMALQLAVIYGRPGLDYRSRELVSTVLLNLAARRLAQQLLKLVPVVGWIASGTLSALSTWALGLALIRYYDEGHILALPTVPRTMALPPGVQRWAQSLRWVKHWRLPWRRTPPV